MLKKGLVIILDTSAFIMGYNPLSVDEEQFTVPLVLEELVSETTGWTRYKIAQQTGKLKILRPSVKFVEQIKLLSISVGDISVLSKVDIQLLALALQLKGEGKNSVIVSDDYAVQNIAELIGAEYKSLATFGIRYQLEWVLCCSACRRKYLSNYDKETCRVCGAMLKRKPLRKAAVRRKLTYESSLDEKEN